MTTGSYHDLPEEPVPGPDPSNPPAPPEEPIPPPGRPPAPGPGKPVPSARFPAGGG
jgi:hypothetical protein